MKKEMMMKHEKMGMGHKHMMSSMMERMMKMMMKHMKSPMKKKIK